MPTYSQTHFLLPGLSVLQTKVPLQHLLQLRFSSARSESGSQGDPDARHARPRTTKPKPVSAIAARPRPNRVRDCRRVTDCATLLVIWSNLLFIIVSYSLACVPNQIFRFQRIGCVNREKVPAIE